MLDFVRASPNADGTIVTVPIFAVGLDNAAEGPYQPVIVSIGFCQDSIGPTDPSNPDAGDVISFLRAGTETQISLGNQSITRPQTALAAPAPFNIAYKVWPGSLWVKQAYSATSVVTELHERADMTDAPVMRNERPITQTGLPYAFVHSSGGTGPNVQVIACYLGEWRVNAPPGPPLKVPYPYTTQAGAIAGGPGSRGTLAL